MKKSLLLSLPLMIAGAFPASASPVVFVAPRVDRNEANPPAGRVVARLEGGNFVRLSRTSRCWNVKSSPGGNSWAWIEGDNIKLERDAATLFPTRLVVWRNREAANQRGTVLRPEKSYEVVYRWVGADRIAVGSCGRHGAVHLQLFDARSGKCVERRMGYEANLPAWAIAVNTL